MGVTELQKLIVPAFDPDKLKAAGIPDYEAGEFLRYKVVPLELLVGAAWNYKEVDEAIKEALSSNVKRQGQVENLNVRELDTGYFEVGNGNTRISVFNENGRQFTIVCDHGKLSEAEFKRRVIEQNETHNNPDNIKLAELMSELTEIYSAQDLAETMPYTEDEIENFGELLNFDFDQFDTGGSVQIDDREKLTVFFEIEDEGIKNEIAELVKKYPSAELK